MAKKRSNDEKIMKGLDILMLSTLSTLTGGAVSKPKEMEDVRPTEVSINEINSFINTGMKYLAVKNKINPEEEAVTFSSMKEMVSGKSTKNSNRRDIPFKLPTDNRGYGDDVPADTEYASPEGEE